MNIVKVSEGIKGYIDNLVDEIAVNNFLVSAIRPIIRMAIENNFYKVNNILKLLADKNGDINFDKLVDETACPHILAPADVAGITGDGGVRGRSCRGREASTSRLACGGHIVQPDELFHLARRHVGL